MKKKQAEIIILTGRDELNLIECPLTLLTDKAEMGQKTLKFIDRQSDIVRHWTITGSDEFGLPCAGDEEIYIAMLALSKRSGFKDRRVHFNQYEMLKLMKWPTSGREYKRLELGMSRLGGVTIYTDYLWNQGKFVKGSFLFHIIEEAFLYQGKRNSQSSYFTWSSVIFDSLISGNIKNLDLETYFSLNTAISKRLFRLLDKRLYKTNRITFDLRELCYEKLGISRKLKYPSLLKQALNSALKEHTEKGLLSSTEYTKTKNGWLLTIEKYKEPALLPEETPPLPEPQKEPDPLLERILTLKIPAKRAAVILQTYSRDDIESWLLAVDLVKPTPKNKAGFFLRALEEKWDMPEVVKEKKRNEEYQREAKLKEEYNEFLIDQAEEYLKTMDPAQIQKEIEEFKPLFIEHWGFDEITMQNPIWKKRLEHDYQWFKARKLNLPTFEQWKEYNK